MLDAGPRRVIDADQTTPVDFAPTAALATGRNKPADPVPEERDFGKATADAIDIGVGGIVEQVFARTVALLIERCDLLKTIARAARKVNPPEQRGSAAGASEADAARPQIRGDPTMARLGVDPGQV